LTQGADAHAGAGGTHAPTGPFAVVAFAPEGIIEDLRKVRAICPRSGVPTLDCHVPLARGLEGRLDPDAALGALARAVDGCPAFTVRTAEPEVIRRAEDADVLLLLEESAPLARLHERVAAALGPSGAPTGGERRPGVTVVEAVPIDAVEPTLAVMAGWRLNYAWVVRDVDLVALERGRLWRSFGRLDFGRP
jgi:hypothetical protein